MTLWFGTGADFNFLTRGAASISLAPDGADASFPLAGLKDARTGVEFRFSNAGVDETITADLNALLNPGFENGFTSGVGNSWTKVGASPTYADDTVNMRSGAHCQSIAGGAAAGYVMQAVTAVPGEQWTVSAWTRAVVAATMSLYIYNRQTGKYWTGSVWGARAAVATTTSASYVKLTTLFTVEDTPTCGNLPNIEIEVQLERTSGGGTAVFDDVEAFPSANFCGCFGHNLDPLIVPTFESSPDNSAWTVQATMNAKYRPSFYAVLANAVASRYWRMKFAGTNSTRSGAISVGELVIANLVQALRDFKPPLRLTWAEMQQRDFGNTGAQWVYALSGGPTVTAAIAFDLVGGWPSTQYKQLRDQLFRLSRNGFYPWLVVIRDADPESCVFGRPSESVTYEAPVLGWTQVNGLMIVGDAMPTRVA